MGAWVTLEFFCLFVFWGLAFLVCCLVFTLSCKNSPSPFCPLPLPFTSSTYYHYFFLLLSTFTSTMGFGWVFLFRARIFLGLFFFFFQFWELSIYHSLGVCFAILGGVQFRVCFANLGVFPWTKTEREGYLQCMYYVYLAPTPGKVGWEGENRTDKRTVPYTANVQDTDCSEMTSM